MNLYIFLIIFVISVRGENRISGGDTVQINAHPYSTSLVTNQGSGAYQHACGGTILTSNAILSAASCFYSGTTVNPPAWWRARVGSAFSNQGGTIHLVRRIAINPGFSSANLTNDIAVLRTTVDINLRWGFTEAARLAGASLTLSPHQPIWAIGWGATTEGGSASAQLREVQFFVVEQSICVSRYAAVNVTVTNDMLCTAWLDVGNRGQCEGDRGSPVLVDGVVVGVHSRSQGCGQNWFPGVNTRTSPNTRWIVAESTSN